MAYRADDRCRKSGPVGNGASRGFGRYNEPGFFDDYGYFNPDPEPVDDSYSREQKEKQKELKAELRQRKQEEEAAHRRRTAQSTPVSQPVDSGLGALPIVAGIFVGLFMAEHDAKNRRQRQSAYSPPPTPAKKEEQEGGVLDAIAGLVFLFLIGRLAVLALMMLFGNCTLFRLLLNTVLSLVGFVVILGLTEKLKKLF